MNIDELTKVDPVADIIDVSKNAFKEIYDTIDKAVSSGNPNGLTTADSFSLQLELYKYTVNQELLTKIASKTAQTVDNVTKGQ